MNKYSSNRHVEQMLVLARETMATLYAHQASKGTEGTNLHLLMQESRDNFDSLLKVLLAEVWDAGATAGWNDNGEPNPYEKEAN